MRGYSKTGKSAFTCMYPFSGKLFCQKCGSKFRRATWGTGKNKKHYWICINHNMNGLNVCDMKAVAEKELEKAFVRAMNIVIGNRETFIENLVSNIYEGFENIEGKQEISNIDARLSDLHQEIMNLVKINVKTGLDVMTYDKEYSKIATEIELLRERRQKLKEADAERAIRNNRVKEIKEYLDSQETLLIKFDEDLFRILIEKVKVHSLVEAIFVFKTGAEVREILG